ncbi:M1 family metallopeptidase [Actinotalea sp. C106]|uniref:M1 family metallopeptidase n=1 Tax=Actinotalea sp. C106 TaxID=2908644 RepID=UPI0020291DDD|nr:M1 family metallopeptidase [Actinotalea sp. C106]
MTADERGDADPYQPDHGSTAFHVEHYDLDLTYRPHLNRLHGTATLRVRTLGDLTELALDLAGLTVEKVTLTGARLARYVHRADRLVLRLGAEVTAGTGLTVVVRYGGNPAPISSPWGPVGWEELTDGVVVASQPTGAPSWFPCNDRPADKASYRTSITVDNPYRVLAHGALVSSKRRASATTWVYEERRPTSTYLATVQIGQYEEHELAAGPVRQVVLVPTALRTAARDRLAHHGEIMTFFTRVFGPYPFATYTLVITEDDLEIPLEAQGLSIFGANHLHSTDGDERLIPHELAHQWFGNSVTPSSWQHIWLSEGFACYAEWLWSEESGGRSAEALASTWHRRLSRLDQDLVLADPGYRRIFDDRVYKRGALTVHALRGALGDEAFFAMVRGWTSRHAGGSVATADLRAHALEHATETGGADLAGAVQDLLDAWLDGAELPPLDGTSGRGWLDALRR